jgi:integrase
MKLYLTDPFLRSLRPAESGRAEYWDTKVTGLCLRVSEANRKTWAVVYRFKGRLRRYTFGVYPLIGLADARHRATLALYEVASGIDPASRKIEERQAETFADLAKEYVDHHAVFKKRGDEDRRLLYGSPHKKRTGKVPHVPIVKRWGGMKARDIRRRDVRELLDLTAVKSPVMANRILALVRKMFNFAIEHDWLDVNPCHMVKRVVRERPRDRVLNENEIRAVWAALEDEHVVMASLIRLRLLTAQRGGELHGARWDEVDLTTGWWTIPGDRSKNGLSHRVPLSPQTLRIFRELHTYRENTARENDAGEVELSPWVFPSTRKTGPHVYHAQKAFERLVARSKVKFRGHDLRRTAASLMVGGGVPRLVVSKILNHVETGVTAVYDRHSYDPEKRAALDYWGNRLEQIVTVGPSAKVLTFTARAWSSALTLDEFEAVALGLEPRARARLAERLLDGLKDPDKENAGL